MSDLWWNPQAVVDFLLPLFELSGMFLEMNFVGWVSENFRNRHGRVDYLSVHELSEVLTICGLEFGFLHE